MFSLVSLLLLSLRDRKQFEFINEAFQKLVVDYIECVVVDHWCVLTARLDHTLNTIIKRNGTK